MILLGIIVSLAAIAFFCWLLFTLAVYALPLLAGITVGLWSYNTGAGLLGAFIAGLIVGAATLGLGQGLIAHLRPVWARMLVALAFVVPASFAGYHATHGIVQHLMPSQAWQVLFSLIGAVAVGATAFARITAMVTTEPVPARIVRA